MNLGFEEVFMVLDVSCVLFPFLRDLIWEFVEPESFVSLSSVLFGRFHRKRRHESSFFTWHEEWISRVSWWKEEGSHKSVVGQAPKEAGCPGGGVKRDGTRSGQPRHRKKTGKIGAPTMRRWRGMFRGIWKSLWKKLGSNLVCEKKQVRLTDRRELKEAKKILLKVHERRR